MEYIEGHNLQKCDRESLTAALDALSYLQNMYWEKRELQGIGHGFEASLPGRQKRGKYLNDAELKRAYEQYLRIYSDIPRSLCHDDFLPFNVLCAEERAVIVDWEYAGILPYPTSLARLIAHCEEDESAFFYMTQADKDYAVEYYFEHLLKEKGIDYNAYRRTLDYFLLYEYCEWIMIKSIWPVRCIRDIELIFLTHCSTEATGSFSISVFLKFNEKSYSRRACPNSTKKR